MAENGPANILITGRPGIGKTTVIMRLADELAEHGLAGFYTEELRGRHGRFGFRAVTLSGHEATLAHIREHDDHAGGDSLPCVGRYAVDVTAFEHLALPELDRECDIVLIDEIGKMECLSSAFVTKVTALLDGPTPVVASVAMRGGGFVAEVKERPDVEIHQVTPTNRSGMPRRLAQQLSQVCQ